jgi:arabinofuranosyltransferase
MDIINKKWAPVIGLALFGVFLLRNLWIGDDAFITLRVVDNWVNGYGLRWNVSERVQVFTHPLWLLFVTPFYLLKSDPYFAFHVPSLLLSLAVAFILFFHYANDFRTILLAGWLMVSSIGFFDYSTSGLENPLSHFLLLLFLYICLEKTSVSEGRRLFWVSFIAGLAALNRVDAILFYLPLLVYEWINSKHTRIKATLLVLGGFSPLILWEIFSLVYYGFFFPNTYYAKLNTTVHFSVFILHGLFYVVNSLRNDPVTLITFFTAGILTLVEGGLQKKLVFLGGTLYFLYVIWIGGDFMMGRFYSALFLLSLVLLLKSEMYERVRRSPFIFPIIAISFLGLGLSSSAHPLTVRADTWVNVTENGIVNEKLFYYSRSGWLAQVGRFEPPEFGGPEGLLARQAGETPLYEDVTIGAFGYYAGPHIYIVDQAALTDPLLARIPYTDFQRVGHFWRDLPDGYIQTLENNYENNLSDPSLQVYYDQLSKIIRGDLFTLERFKLIWEFNLRKYDYLVEDYMGK